jgi:hypothetical protein
MMKFMFRIFGMAVFLNRQAAFACQSAGIYGFHAHALPLNNRFRRLL